MNPLEFEKLIEKIREHKPEMLGKAWDYARPRWAWHAAKMADAHDWAEDGTCTCHGWTPMHILDLVL